MKITRTNAERTPAPTETDVSHLNVVVPYTTPGLTRTALRYVAALEELDVIVRLIDAHIVPFPVPVNEPTVLREFLEKRLRTAAEESSLRPRAELVFTRDRADAFRKILDPRSLVVIAARSWWWFSAEKKLARSLAKAGHNVVVLAGGGSGESAARRSSRPLSCSVR